MNTIGLIGAGGVTEWHLEAINRHRMAKAQWLADVDLERAGCMAEKFGVAKITKDPNELLHDSGVDTIIMALPTFLHREWLIKCARAGKNVLSEKPLCRTVKEGKTVLRAFSEHNKRLAVGYMRRFSPARQKIKALLQSEVLGTPLTWQISTHGPRSDFYRGPNSWMWDREKGGGLIMDGSIHDFDFVCWLMGIPERMYARSSHISDVATAPTQANAVIHFRDGNCLNYNEAWTEVDIGPATQTNYIIGPNGLISLESEFSFTLQTNDRRKSREFKWNSKTLRPSGLGFSWLFYKQLDSFIRDKKDAILCTCEEALTSLSISENIIEAGPEGKMYFH